uniref:G_PROTEIN_RECEP_F1_2 domain-containing protein n=1 Tax=Macrostomum lignano TaxID=282301 RepID=A0A1I8IKI2_9PLAT
LWQAVGGVTGRDRVTCSGTSGTINESPATEPETQSATQPSSQFQEASNQSTQLSSHLVCLFALVAFAAAAYTPEQKNEVVNDIIHEVVPVLSIDTNCLLQNGIDSVMCLVTNLITCFFSSGTNISQLATCLASKCGGNAIQIISCIKLWHSMQQPGGSTQLALGAVTCAVMSLITLETVAGNLLVIASVMKFRRLHSRNCFLLLASLASADVAIGLLVMPYSALYSFLGCWPLGDFYCKFFLSADIMCCTSSILHLCLISLDRYIAVTSPLHYKSAVRPRRIWAAVAFVWSISIGLSFGPVFSGTFSFEQRIGSAAVPSAAENATANVPGQCQMSVNRIYAVVSALTSFFLPLLVMTAAYIRVHRIAADHSQVTRQRKAAASAGTASAAVSRQINSESKATKTLGLILAPRSRYQHRRLLLRLLVPVLPDVHRLPVHAGQLLRPASLGVTLITWIGYANSGINPLLYGSNQREFRLAYLRLLGCRRESDLRYLRSDRRTALSLYRRTAAGLRPTGTADLQLRRAAVIAAWEEWRGWYWTDREGAKRESKSQKQQIMSHTEHA